MLIAKNILPTKVGFTNFTTLVVSSNYKEFVKLHTTTLVENMIWIENISYIIAFIVSAGLATIGIMVSIQMYHHQKQVLYSTLLYQQIFLYSFLFYGIWGNMALHTIISDLSLNPAIEGKLFFTIPLIGIPFMIVSWFMLLKFAYNINEYRFTKAFIYGYFPTLVVLLFTLGVLIHKDIITIPNSADLFVIRIMVVLNFLVNLFFIAPFLIPKKNTPLISSSGFNRKWAILFFMAGIFYSAALWNFTLYGFISICICTLLLFGSGIFIPIVIRIRHSIPGESTNMDFDAFCSFYEISKREAEVIREICHGLSNKAISEKLFITLQTVKDHNHRIYTQTGVKSRVQLANLVRSKTETGQ